MQGVRPSVLLAPNPARIAPEGRYLYLAKHTFTNLMRRLSAAGFDGDFARQAVLPDWWDKSCAKDSLLLPDVELRVARFVGAPLSVVRDPAAPLTSPAYAGAQLRRVRNISRDRLGPAIHAGLQVGAAVLRTMRDGARPVRLPAKAAAEWRSAIANAGQPVLLPDLLRDLWGRGIPVVHVGVLPSPSFQGLACILEGRPVIVLGHALDEPARLAFIIAHEVAHIVNGDCTADRPVVDELEAVADDHEMEQSADEYAVRVLTGEASFPAVSGSTFRELATQASKIEKERGVDAGALVWSWAHRTGDYAVAAMATKALYRAKGGLRALREHYEQHVDVDAASESDRALLRCVYGEPERDAASV